MRKRKVAVVTGTRAEFGIWRSVLEGIAASKKLELQLVVTGMHLQKEFGGTVREVAGSGFEIARRVAMYRKGEAAADSLAHGVAGLGRAFRELESEVVMVLGDRLEMLAAAGAAVAERRVIGHVHGGERAPGTWDEQIRHAVTKMAHVHFCATEAAGKRILQMGEERGRVHVVGAPGLDRVEAEWEMVGPIVSKVRGYRRSGKRGEAAVVVLHPTGGTEDEERGRAEMMLRALEEAGVYAETVVGPNNDSGYEGILAAYRKAGVRVEMNLEQRSFWSSLAYSSFLIGNSSSGIIEAASFGVPAINLGDRQKGRERSGNVIDVAWKEGVAGIRRGIERAVDDGLFRRSVARRRNVYGDGGAGGRIVKVLEGMPFGMSVTKVFCDR